MAQGSSSSDRAEADRASECRAELVDKLCAERRITSAAVEAAFRGVARERFLPDGVSLEVAYGLDDAVVTKRDEQGAAISSVSSAYIQAWMLEQAELRAGMTVLEIGSGGLNAALIAEVIGASGRVVSVDIDPEVTDRAAALLDKTGYAGRVRVLVGDAEYGVPGEGLFDAIIVTVGAWDIAPAWLDQLVPDGVLVVPLTMNLVTRTIGFRRDGDHLISTSTGVAGFVPMQGVGQHPERVVSLADAKGNRIKLRFDCEVLGDGGQLEGVLITPRTEAWSGVTMTNGVSFADLHLWFAWHLPGFCRLAVDDGTELAAAKGWYPFGFVLGDSLAYLAVRPAMNGAGVEFGAGAYGLHGGRAAAVMVEQIRAWDRQARRGPEPTFGFWPNGSDRSRIPPDVMVLEKRHGLVTISWPRSVFDV